ncbi:helix-turn-helix domain-containing protein [Lacticaseibacillus sp. N501-2]|uniref:helix-turn-helix domain-containing protein n=1 Tax=Lacticaseibacillus salsurae TaxID=3367729 RepID=UPI0038B25179
MNAERLKQLRTEHKGLRQVDLAQSLGISASAYSSYEQGVREPDDATKRRLADYFSVSLDYLLGRTEHRATPTLADVDVQLANLLSELDDNASQPTLAGQKLTGKQRKVLRESLAGTLNVARALSPTSTKQTGQ